MNKQEAAVALPLFNNYPPQAWLLNNTWDEVEVEASRGLFYNEPEVNIFLV